MSETFTDFVVDTSATHIAGSRGGHGEAVLLLHGIPETRAMWRDIAPTLASRWTVVMTDLRGFGGSGVPPSAADHSPYSMRQLALDQVEVMATLGFDRFAVVGHDRGARCGYRMALDHPDRVAKLSVLDIIPTADAFARADAAFAVGFWVWSFLAAPEPVPERLVAGAPEVFVDHMLDSWSAKPCDFPPEVRERYIATFRDPERVHAICEQYRAAVSLDVALDEADRGVRRITCPTLVLWSSQGPLASWYDPLSVWREWADAVEGRPVDAGHFLPEEAPEAITSELIRFLES